MSNWWWNASGGRHLAFATLTLRIFGAAGEGAGASLTNVHTGAEFGYALDAGTHSFVLPRGTQVRVTPWTPPDWFTPPEQTVTVDGAAEVELHYVSRNVTITVALYDADAARALVTDVTAGGKLLATMYAGPPTELRVPNGHVIRVTPADVPGHDTPAVQEFTATGGEWAELSWTPQTPYWLEVMLAGPEAASVQVLDQTTGRVITAFTGNYGHYVQVPRGHLIRVVPQPVAGYATPLAQEQVATGDFGMSFEYLPAQVTLNVNVVGPQNAETVVYRESDGLVLASRRTSGPFSVALVSGTAVRVEAYPVDGDPSQPPAPRSLTVATDTAITVAYVAQSRLESFTLRQVKRATGQGADAATATVALNAPAAAGTLLVAYLVVDKSAGSFTVPAGWTEAHRYVGGSVSALVLWCRASGGEGELNLTWSTPQAHHALALLEFTTPADWTGVPVVTAMNSGDDPVNDLDFAPVTFPGAGLLLGLLAVDSMGAQQGAVGPSSWDGAGWSAVLDMAGTNNTSSGMVNQHVSVHPVAGAMTLDTHARIGINLASGVTTADQAWAALVYFPQGDGTVSTGAALEWTWNGLPEPDAATVSVKVSAPGAAVALHLGTDAGLAGATTTVPVTVDPATLTARVRVTGLAPGTTYHYGVVVGGLLSTRRGRFKTAPAAGAASFTFASSSCTVDVYNGVFDRIAARAPNVFLHLGDLHYSDNNSPSVASQRASLARTLAYPTQQTLLARHSTSWVWSDHDFCGDNSDRTATGASAAAAAVRGLTPYAYAHPQATYHTFVMGRTQFIVTDTRSQMDPVPVSGASASPALTKLGATQKQWFKDVCLAAKAARRVIVWACSEPWTGPAEDGTDRWQSYAAERRELADFFQQHDLTRSLVIVSGDAHMLGYDDGTNSNFASTPVGPGPACFVTAPLSQVGSVKGTPMTAHQAGGDPGFRGQYGHFTVTDTGAGTIALQGDLYTSDAAGGGAESLWGTQTVTLAVPPPPPPAPVTRALTLNLSGVATAPVVVRNLTTGAVPVGGVVNSGWVVNCHDGQVLRVEPGNLNGYHTPAPQDYVMDADKAASITYAAAPSAPVTRALTFSVSGVDRAPVVVRNLTTGAVPVGGELVNTGWVVNAENGETLRVEPGGVTGYAAPAPQDYVMDGDKVAALSYVASAAPAAGRGAGTVTAGVGTVAATPVPAGARDVKEFGARGDGVTDDRAALQAAANSGASLYFPPGTYRLSGEVVFNGHAGVTLVGAGAGQTTIQALDSFGSGRALLYLLNTSGVTLGEMTLHGRGLTHTTWIDNVFFSGGQNAAVRNVVSRQCGGCGIHTENVTGLTVEGVTMSGTRMHGLWTDRTSQFVTRRVQVSGEGTYPITARIALLYTVGNQGLIEECVLRNIANTATKTEGVSNATYRRVIVDGCAKDGIKIMPLPERGVASITNGVIENCEVSGYTGEENNGSSYFHLSSTLGGRISGCIAHGTDGIPSGAQSGYGSYYEDGIRLEPHGGGPRCRDILIYNNEVKNAKTALRINAENVEVYGNVLRNSGNKVGVNQPWTIFLQGTGIVIRDNPEIRCLAAETVVLYDHGAQCSFLRNNFYGSGGLCIYAGNNGNSGTISDNTFQTFTTRVNRGGNSGIVGNNV